MDYQFPFDYFSLCVNESLILLLTITCVKLNHWVQVLFF